MPFFLVRERQAGGKNRWKRQQRSCHPAPQNLTGDRGSGRDNAAKEEALRVLPPLYLSEPLRLEDLHARTSNRPMPATANHAVHAKNAAMAGLSLAQRSLAART